MSDRPIPEGWKAMKFPGLLGEIGPLLSKRDGDGWLYALQTDERHANPIGLIHGGTLATLVDHAMSMIAWSAAGRQSVVTVHMDTTFLSAARPGDFLEIAATTRKRTGGMVFMEAIITTDGREIMSAAAVLKIIKKE